MELFVDAVDLAEADGNGVGMAVGYAIE